MYIMSTRDRGCIRVNGLSNGLTRRAIWTSRTNVDRRKALRRAIMPRRLMSWSSATPQHRHVGGLQDWSSKDSIPPEIQNYFQKKSQPAAAASCQLILTSVYPNSPPCRARNAIGSCTSPRSRRKERSLHKRLLQMCKRAWRNTHISMSSRSITCGTHT
jgi:hypothetical protein